MLVYFSALSFAACSAMILSKKPGFIRVSLALITMISVNGVAQAQVQDIETVQKNLAIFSGILEESLGLNDSTGLFGMSLGGVESTYLYRQGAVLEIRSALANRRNRMGLASLSSAMQALQLRQNPFEAMRSRAAPMAEAASQALSTASASLVDTDAQQQMMDRIANIDYSVVAQTAMQQATHSARALRALGELDDSDYDELNQQLEDMRGAISTSVNELRGLEQQVRSQAGVTSNNPADLSTANTDSATLAVRLDELIQRMEPMRDEALAVAQDLKQRSEQAERDYALAWQADLLEFEDSLYLALCEYGSTLSAIPEQENISIILQDLGEDADDNRRSDQVHVIAKADISACGRGEFDAAGLQERAFRYHY